MYNVTVLPSVRCKLNRAVHNKPCIHEYVCACVCVYACVCVRVCVGQDSIAAVVTSRVTISDKPRPRPQPPPSHSPLPRVSNSPRGYCRVTASREYTVVSLRPRLLSDTIRLLYTGWLVMKGW